MVSVSEELLRKYQFVSLGERHLKDQEVKLLYIKFSVRNYCHAGNEILFFNHWPYVKMTVSVH